MNKKVRSEYIKNLIADKNELSSQLTEATEESLKNILGESINKNLRTILSEAEDDEDDDSYEEEEVDTDEIDDVEDSESNDASDEEGTESDDTAEADVVDSDSEWDELDQYKDEDGEYDLTSLDKDSVIRVLKVMNPEDGVRIVQNDNGSITISDEETDKEYIIDIDGSLDGDSEDTEELDFEVVADDMDECQGRGCKRVNEGEVNLGYTDKYTGSAMSIDNNEETADAKETYSMDKGARKGTNLNLGQKGDQAPFEIEVELSESSFFHNPNVPDDEQLEDLPDEIDIDMDESELNELTTVTKQNPSVRGTAMTHTSDVDNFQPRNGSRRGEHIKDTSRNTYSEAIKRKANAIFRENRELKAIAEQIKNKLNEAIVVNSSLGNIIKLVVENSTTHDEKLDIVKRFDNVKTINESKALYNTISNELESTKRTVSSAKRSVDTSLNEAKNNRIVETTLLSAHDDLSETIDLMERMDRIK